MSKTLKIAHEKIKAYLKREIVSEITAVREKDPVYRLLFELIDQAQESYPDFEKISDQNIAKSFSAIEDLISGMVARTTQEQQAIRFLAGLQHSSIFYERAMAKLAQLTPAISDEPLPGLESVELQSDEKLLTNMGILATGDHDESVKISKKKGLEKNWLKDWTRGLIQVIKPVPRYVYALAATACILMAIFISGDYLQKEDPFAEFVWDDHVPYEYDVGSFRGAEEEVKYDPQFRIFVNQFKLGMSDYVICEYAGAINIWNSMEPIVKNLIKKDGDKNFTIWIRDYYFYMGVSYLAMARSKYESNKNKGDQLSNAVTFLKKADFLTSENRLKDFDRELFYLGMAYFFSKNKEEAYKKFKNIKEDSKFYSKVTIFLN